MASNAGRHAIGGEAHSGILSSPMRDGRFSLLMTDEAVLLVLTFLMEKGQNLPFKVSFVRLLSVKREFPL